MIFSLLFLSHLTFADASYYRVWRGYSDHADFLSRLPRFMRATVEVYPKRVLNNYFVLIPPKVLRTQLPDELALLAIRDKSDYRSLMRTNRGRSYARSHWQLFSRGLSKSAPMAKNASFGRAFSAFTNTDWRQGKTRALLYVLNGRLGQRQMRESLMRYLGANDKLSGFVVDWQKNYIAIYECWKDGASSNPPALPKADLILSKWAKKMSYSNILPNSLMQAY